MDSDPPTPADQSGFDAGRLIGQSPAFMQALELIGKSARCNATVLIEGETGTGKELAARAIHYLGPRRNTPFIPVNCGAIPESLLESELFGHERGAFTDAREATAGLVAQAESGSLLLDEIEAMSPRAQIVLLRFLQDHRYQPVGGKISRLANIRVIASSNADIEALTRNGSFRSDLFFRLNVLTIRLPSLRERPGDAVLLAQEFSRRLGEQYGQPTKELHADTVAFLQGYHWPGNVRELENLIHREYLFSDGPVIRISQANPHRTPFTDTNSSPPQGFKSAKAEAVKQFERSYLLEVLSRSGGNFSMAARLAGKERSAFCRLVRKHWPHGGALRV